jgi:hypothetical protein
MYLKVSMSNKLSEHKTVVVCRWSTGCNEGQSQPPAIFSDPQLLCKEGEGLKKREHPGTVIAEKRFFSWSIFQCDYELHANLPLDCCQLWNFLHLATCHMKSVLFIPHLSRCYGD